MPGHNQEKWFELYKLAVLELEQSLMDGRIADARTEIVKRLEVLRDLPGFHDKEQHAIDDALYKLRVLEREDAGHTAEEQRKLAESALERLRSLSPRIKPPSPSD